MPLGSVCLTHESLEDGIGSQVWNRIEFLAIATYLGSGYKNPEFQNFDYNYGDGILDETAQNKVLEKLNFESVPALMSCSHTTHLNFPLIISHPFLLRTFINLCKFLSLFFKINFLVSAKNAQTLINSKELFSFQRERLILNLIKTLRESKVLQSTAKRTDGKTILVLVVIPWARNSQIPERHIPIEWYYKILRELVGILSQHGQPFKIIIHTDGLRDLDSNRTRWYISPGTQIYWGEKKIHSKNKFTYSYLDVPSAFDFLSDIDYEVRTNVSPLDIWEDFKEASIIIGSKSALSFVGLFLSSNSAFRILPDTIDTIIPDTHYVPLEKRAQNVLPISFKHWLFEI